MQPGDSQAGVLLDNVLTGSRSSVTDGNVQTVRKSPLDHVAEHEVSLLLQDVPVRPVKVSLGDDVGSAIGE